MLTLDQKRSLGIRLGIMEEEMNTLRSLLRGGSEEKLFSRVTDDLTEREKLLLGEKMERLTAYLADLKNSFDLRHSRKEITLRGLVKAIALYLIVQLEEARSFRLKGYGEVAPSLSETLDPILKEMTSLLQQMESMI
jgi:hypothetical protein